ncbi:hypothetical protein [Proteus mirabilis]|uniref:hypothetical protein n=1 Tax=Proteus mirabilis TaxID=584 RepID=UPI000A5D9B3A|nr:hypothetical protein [Proteus mirabilis]MCZ4601328.1 hypothetical protein [Proteus mirabilis]MDF7256406.1 hypothetical protein [Proteus mirabilis]MDF7350233.1 hypothetical protein [Proteus mirabilis]
MINLTPYSDSSISFLRSIINSKNRGDYKDRISNLFNSLNTYYQNYDTSFDNNTLNLIQQSLIFSDLEKKIYSNYIIIVQNHLQILRINY